jgi:small subunit ribosomal protein S3
MGHKVHPTGFRIGVIRGWQAKWFADRHYAAFLQEDLKIREAIEAKYADASISAVEIERQANQVLVTIHTARPGIVIGRGGQRVDEMRAHLERLIGKRAQLNIKEIQQPELDAYLVAKNIAEQMERRIAYRRAMKQALARTMQAGAKGIKVACAGRLGGAEIARRLNMHEGQVPLHTLRADIDYGFTEAHTIMGRIGVKAWIYKGEILPEVKEEAEEAPAEAVAEATAEAPAPPVAVEEKPATAAVPEEKAKIAPSVPPEPEKVAAEAAVTTVSETPPAAGAEKKPAKPTVRRRTRARTSTSARPRAKSAQAKPSAESGVSDGTTQKSEIPQDTKGTP